MHQTKPSKLFECWDIAFNYHPNSNFNKLPTEQYLIDLFQENKDKFFRISEHPYNLSSAFGLKNIRRVWELDSVLMFKIKSTLFIKGMDELSKKSWPWILREKGYFFAKQSDLNMLMTHDHEFSYLSFRLVNRLDNDWPDDWILNQCLLRKIESDWYLYLCKVRNG
jgi:hypothetical protein